MFWLWAALLGLGGAAFAAAAVLPIRPWWD